MTRRTPKKHTRIEKLESIKLASVKGGEEPGDMELGIMPDYTLSDGSDKPYIPPPRTGFFVPGGGGGHE